VTYIDVLGCGYVSYHAAHVRFYTGHAPVMASGKGTKPCWQCEKPTVNKGPRPYRLKLTSDHPSVRTYLTHLPCYLGEEYQDPFSCGVSTSKLVVCGTCVSNVMAEYECTQQKIKTRQYFATKRRTKKRTSGGVEPPMKRGKVSTASKSLAVSSAPGMCTPQRGVHPF
jgi:hypothetical protein